MNSLFAPLLGALGEDRLKQHMAERRVLHAATSADFSPTSLFSFDKLADLIARRMVPAETLRVMAGRTKLDLGALGALDGPWVHPLAMRAFIGRPVTAVLLNIDRTQASLWPFVCDVENWFRDHVSLSAVASFGQVSGLELHYDCRNLLVLQLEGTKRWTFHGEPEPGPARRQTKPGAASDYAITAEVEMRPGDVMFVPAGLRHWCEPLGRSLHMGILADQLSGVTVAEQLLERARTDEALNEFLIPPLGSDTCAATVQRFRDRLIDHVREMDIAGILAAERLRTGRVREMDLSPDPAKGGDERWEATLVLSYWPANVSGRVNVRGASLTVTREAAAIAAALNDGPQPPDRFSAMVAGEVPADRFMGSLDSLVEAGLVRVGPAATAYADDYGLLSDATASPVGALRPELN